MSIINSLLGLFLGNKYERDLKEINPYIEKIHIEYQKLQVLSNDSLRELTDGLKAEIHSNIENDENEIKLLREKQKQRKI
ncbi:MAG: hypothetical protein IPN68_15640 [Bacteroidetes bacterium]|nr:hypothetical protein [Bacteroidota bacterium]